MRVNSGNYVNFAFTLAEVLVTLSIIGVLAAITIPTLLQNTQEQELKTAFKKAYSDVAQATQKVIQDNGGTLRGICVDEDHNCLKNKYVAYLNVIKNCNYGQTLGNCWTSIDNFKYLDGTSSSLAEYPALILNNGSFLRLIMKDDDCKDNFHSPKGECAFITVDVNGFKKPNTAGKDIFWIHVYDNGIAPWGVPDDASNSTSAAETCNKNSTGTGCAALVLQDIAY